MVHASWPRRSTIGRSARRAETRPFRGSMVLTSGPPGCGGGGVPRWRRTRSRRQPHAIETEGIISWLGGCRPAPLPHGKRARWACEYRPVGPMGSAARGPSVVRWHSGRREIDAPVWPAGIGLAGCRREGPRGLLPVSRWERGVRARRRVRERTVTRGFECGGAAEVPCPSRLEVVGGVADPVAVGWPRSAATIRRPSHLAGDCADVPAHRLRRPAQPAGRRPRQQVEVFRNAQKRRRRRRRNGAAWRPRRRSRPEGEGRAPTTRESHR